MHKIYDNVLPKETFEFFRSQCVDNVSWDFVENSAYRQADIKNLEIADSKNKYSFARTVFGRRDGSKLPEFEVCVANITFMLAGTDISINGLKRIRFGLLTGSDKKLSMIRMLIFMNLIQRDYFTSMTVMVKQFSIIKFTT